MAITNAAFHRAFAAALIGLALGFGIGVTATVHAYGDRPECHARIERWNVPVTMPCEHWNPPTPREGTPERVR